MSLRTTHSKSSPLGYRMGQKSRAQAYSFPQFGIDYGRILLLNCCASRADPSLLMTERISTDGTTQ